MKKYSLLFCLLISSNLLFGQFWFLGQQSKERYEAAKYVPYATMGFGLGSSTYMGDLMPSSALIPYGVKSTRWNLGFHYTKHFSRHLAYKASLSLIRIAGDDNYYAYGPSDVEKAFAANYQRNLHFRNDLKELSLVGIYDIMAQTPFRKKRPQFSPYVFLGVAAAMSSPQARGPANITTNSVEQSDWVNLRNYSGISASNSGTENSSYSPFVIAIPVGLGFRYKIDQTTDIGFEVSYRQTFTDYLDDVSDNRNAITTPYNELTIRTEEPYAANTLKQVQFLGTTKDIVPSKGYDRYFTTQFQLIFHIGKSAGRIN